MKNHERKYAMKRYIALILMVFCVNLAFAEDKNPMDSLKEPIDRVIDILKDPKFEDSAKKEKQAELIWEIIEDVFDFKKIGELTLGNFRKDFSEEQLDEFTEEFADLLGNTYLKKIQGEYENEKVDYLSQKIGSGANSDKAMVETVIIREGVGIPVIYTMWKNKGVWRIYDVKVEGVSLVRNYRNQFQKILIDKKPDDLIEKIRRKNENRGKGQGEGEIE